MTEPPTTLAEFEDAAREGQGRRAPADHGSGTPPRAAVGLAFPLQNLMAAYGPTEPINDWIFQKPGATIDTPTNLEAAEHLAAVDRGRLLPRGRQRHRVHRRQRAVRQGRGRVHLQRRLGERRPTTRRCPATSASSCSRRPRRAARVAAMSAPLTYGIAAKAKNADCAAFFLNWVATNETARQINVDVGGSNPGGPADLPIPTVAGGLGDQRDPGGRQRGRRRTTAAMDFIANATGAIFAQGWTPELQKMVGGKQDAAGPAQGRPGRVREGARPVTRGRRRRRRRAGAQPHAPAATAPAARRGGSPASGGSAAQTLVGWLFVLPALVDVRGCSSCSRSS